MTVRRTYEETHPWLTFKLDMRNAPVELWTLLGEARSKIEHIAESPLKGLSRLGEGESGGVGFLEGDQAGGELEQGEVVLVFLRPADQDRAVAVEP